MINEYNLEDLTEYQSESKSWLFGLVRQYIIDNKIRNWNNIPKYDEISYIQGWAEMSSHLHYYSNVIELAFKSNGISQKIIDKIEPILEGYTRVGYLRLEHDDPTCHYIITINQIKMVINLL